jgi:phosphoglycerate dehydrogenase-like enzyme
MVKVLVAFPLDEEYMKQIRSVEGIDTVKATEHDEVLKEVKDAEVLFSNKITPEMFRRAEKLKWIQSPFVGVDSLLIEDVKKSDVIVTSTKGIHSIQASDHVFALILFFSRKLNEIVEEKRRKFWKKRHPFPFEPLDELNGKTLGIIGLGSIGREVARKGKCFGMKVLGIKRTPEEVDNVDRVYGIEGLDEVLKESDFLVLCVPHTKETEKLIGERELRLMKNSAYLINIARGGVVDEEALIRALREGWIRGAGLDVFSQEPLPPSSPLWEMENVIITPHVAGSTPYYWDRAVSIFVENLGRFLRGEELINVVDKEKGY